MRLFTPGLVLAAMLASTAVLTASAPATSPGPDARPLAEWRVLGPLSTSLRPAYYRAQLEFDFLGVEGAGAGRDTRPDMDAPVTVEGRTFTWLPVRAEGGRDLQLADVVPDGAGDGVFYAAAVFDHVGGDALLRLSSVSSQRAWLNGRQVADVLNPIRELETETVTVPVQLQPGANLLLLKVSQSRRTPARVGAVLLPAYSLGQHLRAWLPFVLIVAGWVAIALIAERRRPAVADAHAAGRLLALDALRGFDMFWITGGGLVIMRVAEASGNYALLEQLDHATWHGFHFWDLIFPLFLFIVGASIPFAFASRLARGDTPGHLHGHILRRALTIFAVGLFLAGGMKRVAIADVRIAGVLQRIAICYAAAAFAFLHLRARTIAIVAAAVLLGYWAVMALVPVPGVGAGVLLPDLNLANWVDAHYLPGHFYQGTWDNEGILSTLPAIVTCLIGVLAGTWLRTDVPERRKVHGLWLAGVAALAAGWLWHPWFPVNKLLWSSSYVLVAGGWSLLLLGTFYDVLDVRKWRSWSFPFVVIGVNAIAVYAFEGLIGFREAATRLAGGNVAALFGGYAEAWLALVTYLLTWGALYWLYRRRIFIKL